MAHDELNSFFTVDDRALRGHRGAENDSSLACFPAAWRLSSPTDGVTPLTDEALAGRDSETKVMSTTGRFVPLFWRRK